MMDDMVLKIVNYRKSSGVVQSYSNKWNNHHDRITDSIYQRTISRQIAYLRNLKFQLSKHIQYVLQLKYRMVAIRLKDGLSGINRFSGVVKYVSSVLSLLEKEYSKTMNLGANSFILE